MMTLTDNNGRRIRKLRLSLTDKCNLRCHYCMPVDQTFMDEQRYLGSVEIKEVLSELVSMGLEEVRLTGGEPLLRKSFTEIIESISSIGLKKIALTTNGILLNKYFEVLKKNNVFHLNISLDSLNEDNFKRITFGNHYSQVMENILKAHDMGFVVKINTVMMKGINDHELLDFVTFSETTGIEVRFLELMRIGYACQEQKDQFISANDLIQKLKEDRELKSVTMPLDSTSFNFVTNMGAQIGFIASESQPFCGQCSRWRLSADGILRACLLKDDGLKIAGLHPDERLTAYQTILGMKPILRPAEVAHQMNVIGG